MPSTNPSPTLVINDQVNALWKQGKDVLHLAFGESRFPVHPLIKNALTNAVSNRSYLPSSGTEKLKKIVADYYSKKLNTSLHPNQILIGVGSKSLLFSMIHALDGDILLPKPSWVSYSSIAKLIGKNLTRFKLDRDKDFRLNIDRVDEAYRSAISKGQNPKSIIINSPNNPIGNTFPKIDIETVSSWAKKQNVAILSDEIYRLITHEGVSYQSSYEFYPEKTIVFSGLSKHLSLGGWRIGIAILPNNGFGAKLGSHFNAVAGSIWSCVPAPFQIIAETAFSGDDQIESYIQTCRNIHETRTHYVYHGLKELGLNCPKPTGAFYVYASFKNFEKSLNSMGIDSCQKLAEYLLNKYEIATLPGSAFGDDPENLCLRISTSYLDMETDEKAQQILDIFSNGIDSTSFMKDYHPRTNLFLSRMNKFLSSLN